MTSLRPFTCNDLFKFNNVNFDSLTETYFLSFYTKHLGQWPEYFQLAESPNECITAYIMGKSEGEGAEWHGHVTALTVSSDYRRMGLGAKLMKYVEDISEKKRAYFMDLFVRQSNKVAINMYRNMGYIIYRTIPEYYCSNNPREDAHDMRKALSRDVKQQSIIPYANVYD
ncbi:N-alpha-acetyltransferase 20 [Drosophila grimshawi]|uniref:N-alpha-acetyltransferase 20 n=1 Tax=Drosophila grimshawi TaxID=7222 RepID=B4JW53_DROGR|nr:N-alpha-acetyltransferase 20 [Drosophila grimshawi]EDV98191.1 GH22808 [Drosophila grimshawi]